jgi:hypothetical protein
LDLGFLAAGVLAGAASIAYPYGHDQALYGYIAREWLEGRLPYVASFDMKTPGIYSVYAVATVLFGKGMWGIRVLDLACILALGWISGALAWGREDKPIRGLRGASAFAASLLYYGFFYFWDTAQCESFCAAFAMGGLFVAARLPLRRLYARSFVSGLFGGVALLFKPPALCFLAVTAAVLAARAWESSGASARGRRTLAAVAIHVLGGIVPAAVLVLYFHSHHAAGVLYDILVVNNRHYVIEGRWVNSVSDVVNRICLAANWLSPVGWVLAEALLVIAILARRRKDQTRARTAILVLVLFACVVLAVTM